jgi:general secretion pathway protein D
MTMQERPLPLPVPRATALTCRVLAATLLLTSLPVVHAAPRRSASANPVADSRAHTPVTLNFVNADIEAVSRAIGAMLDRPIIVDPRVKGTITVYSEQPIPVREAYLNYLAALRGLGFTVVENAGLLKVVPEADAKVQAGTVQVGAPALRGDQVVTQVFRLNYESANNLVTVLRPLISPNNTINADPTNNTLVITDYADNLQRIARIIAALDTASSTDVEVIPLKHAVASDLAPLVQRLAEGGNATGVPQVVPGMAMGGAVSVLADPRSNSLIVRAPNAARLVSLHTLITQLDTASPDSGGGPSGNIYVVHLKNADAGKLAQVLRAAYQPPSLGGNGTNPAGQPVASNVNNSSQQQLTQTTPASNINGGSGSTGSAMSAAAATPITPSGNPQTGGFVQADPASNSLIITAPEPMYRQLRALIDTLDVRRPQVYIESMIVELTGSNAADIGLQLQGISGQKGDTNLIGLGTNFGSGVGSILGASKLLAQGLTGLAQADESQLNGVNFAVAHQIGTHYTLGVLARALETIHGTNIISTPNLLTLDNEEAKIVVGQNVPFITGQFTNTGTATTSPFQTIERKDVGITLRIKPQVGDDGTVRMAIYQESSSVSDTQAAGTTNSGPTTNERSIETNVVVNDGDVLVLGGLIQDSYNTSKSKVPLLGDIPLIGGLFRSESRSKVRTNLMVFLRPVVLRDENSVAALTRERYDLMRDSQQLEQPSRHPLMPGLNQGPVLPPLQQVVPPAHPLAPPDTTTPQKSLHPAPTSGSTTPANPANSPG